MPRTPPAPSAAADDFPRLGMSVRRLGRIVDSQRGGRQALRGLTTSQVKLRVFVPLTAATRLSMCAQLQAQGDPGVGVATWYVSHAWARPFLELLEALEHFFDSQAQGRDTAVWLDVVSVAQHAAPSRPCRWFHSLHAVIQSIGNMVMVMAPWDQPTVLLRAWCLFELHACGSDSNCRFEVALPQLQRRRLASDLAATAEAFNAFLLSARMERGESSLAADRDGVFAAVRDSVPVGLAGVDAVVRRLLRSWLLGQLKVGLEGARAAGEQDETVVWLNAIGKLLCDHCMYADAVPFLEQSVALCKQQHAPGALGYLASHLLERLVRPCHLNLATAYKGAGDYSSAAAIEEGILTCRRMLLGREAQLTVQSLGSLACTYCSIGDTARAAPMFDEALALQRRVLGEQHPSTIRCSLMFACLHLRSGRLVDAQSLVAGACAGSEQPRFNVVLSVFVRALSEFYGGKMDAQGLETALHEARDALGCGVEMETIEVEYNAATAGGC